MCGHGFDNGEAMKCDGKSGDDEWFLGRSMSPSGQSLFALGPVPPGDIHAALGANAFVDES